MIALLAGAALALAVTQTSESADVPATDEILVVDEKDVSRMWKAVKTAAPSGHRVKRLRQSCVTFGVVIEADGTTSTHRVLRSDPPGVLDAAGLEAVKKWRFEPGPANAARVPVYTTFSVTWGPSPGELNRCRVDVVVPDKAL